MKKSTFVAKEHFFNPQDHVIIRGDEEFRKKSILSQNLNCTDCGLNKKSVSPCMKASGGGRKKIMIVGEFPGLSEDRSGKPFVGSQGSDIRQALISNGIIPDRDVIFTYANRCYPRKKARPTESQIQACNKFLMEDIQKYDPLVIIAVGDNAFESLAGSRLTGRADTPFSSWVGECIPDQKLKRWICPIDTPSYVAKLAEESSTSPAKSAPVKIWLDQIKEAIDHIRTPVPDNNHYLNQVICTTDKDEVIDFLSNLNGKEVTLDYETTGLKPHREGHRILAASVYDGEVALSFPFWFDDKTFIGYWKKFMTSAKIKRIAHNITFETLWTYHATGIWPSEWYGDSMLAAHVLHNKKKVGLKYLVYVKLGILGYDDKAERYIEAPEAEKKKYGANGFNRMINMPLTDMLQYCGLDSVFGHVIWNQMHSQLKSFQKKGLQLLIEGQYVLAKVQENGIFVSYKKLAKSAETITQKIIDAQKRISTCSELKKWDLRDDFNPASPDHLKHLLYNRLEFEPPFYTKNNTPSTDVKALTELNLPITQAILELRRWDKALNTYLHQFEVESVDSAIHSSFSTGTVKSFRSSSFDPALQNIPTRDKEVKEAVRNVMVPSRGNFFKGYDYKSIEVIGAALYTQDKNLLKYVRDLSTDMHRDLAIQLYCLNPDQVTKDRRYWSKNRFVFPEFYGSYWKKCAVDLWKGVLSDPELRQILRDNRISTYEKFEMHVQDVEEDFWGNRFYEYAMWKKEQALRLHKNGYVDSLTGFRYWAPMSEREACNYPIQGCLAGHSRVLTKEGLIPIKNLVNQTVVVWTGFKWATAIGLDRGPCERVQIELESGLTISCDTRHKLKNEMNQWVEFSDLHVGSLVALPRLYDPIETSESMTWEYVYGFIVGDGCISNSKRKSVTIVVGETKKDDLLGIHNFLQSHGFGKKYGGSHYRYDIATGKYKLWIQNQDFATQLEDFGFVFGFTAHTKSVPHGVWTSTPQQMRDFMEGLWKSDGSRGLYQERNLTMCNKRLLQEVQVLISFLGFDSALKQTNEGWRLIVNRKKDKAKPVRRYPSSAIHTHVSSIDSSNYTDRNKYITDSRCFNSGNDVGQYVGERIIEHNVHVNTPEIYRYDRITRIQHTKVMERTYTMSVDDSLHQFVADGVVHKNSSFHILLWSLIQIQNEMEEREITRSVIGSEIHDQILMDCHPEDEQMIDYLVWKWGTQEVRNHWDWITVPLLLEQEKAEINEPWGKIKSCGYLENPFTRKQA